MGVGRKGRKTAQSKMSLNLTSVKAALRKLDICLTAFYGSIHFWSSSVGLVNLYSH